MSPEAITELRDRGFVKGDAIAILDGRYVIHHEDVLAAFVLYDVGWAVGTAAFWTKGIHEHKRAVVMLVREARRLFSKYETVVALRGEHALTSESLLRYGGFAPVGRTKDGEVWQYA